ncbi:MAG: RagB/SusD family nutrient uptake outer membrane protein, partial [Flavobacteriales bacterium]
FILSDLVDAQKSLTAAYPSDGHARPNLYTVQALLAKVYLYLGQYQSAIIAANSVIDNGGFSLQSLNNVFINGSAEAIWQIPSNSSYSQTVEGSTFIPYNATSLPNYYLSAQLLSAFEPGDLRKTSWLNFSRVNIGGVPATFYYPFKYKQRVAGQAPVEGYSILRLAEIYLIRAESLAQTNKIAEALVDVNKIRSRANLSNVNSTVKEVILNAILHERQVELFCESGNRWFDLKRSNTINSMLNNKVGWIPSAALFPIPVAERQANPALTQNPEY